MQRRTPRYITRRHQPRWMITERPVRHSIKHRPQRVAAVELKPIKAVFFDKISKVPAFGPLMDYVTQKIVIGPDGIKRPA